MATTKPDKLKIKSMAEETANDEDIQQWIPEDEERDRKTYFDHLMETVAMPYRNQFEPVWQDAYDIHEQLADADYNDERTNVVLPLSTMVIETKLADELENRPDLYFEAQEKNDVPKTTTKNK